MKTHLSNTHQTICRIKKEETKRSSNLQEGDRANPWARLHCKTGISYAWVPPPAPTVVPSHPRWRNLEAASYPSGHPPCPWGGVGWSPLWDAHSVGCKYNYLALVTPCGIVKFQLLNNAWNSSDWHILDAFETGCEFVVLRVRKTAPEEYIS